MIRKFRVIQGGKGNKGSATESTLRLFRAHSTGNITRRGQVYHDVKFNWYCVERPEPVAPWEDLIANSNRLEERHLNALKKDVSRYFTEEEIVRLGNYLQERYGLELSSEEVALPIKRKGVFFAEGDEVIYDFIELSEQENYHLPFKVWGYYTITGCLSSPDLNNGVLFLQKSFELLGLSPAWSQEELERVAKTIYERDKLLVKSQEEL
ncbi:MAG: hypothetical protein RBS57_17085 [Desulforhabdus sp.]|jgi:hypothetical protein|nr:hypothetical protein [Desulforhabdus sp.]